VGTPQTRRGGESDDVGSGAGEGKKRGKKGDGAGFDPTKKGGVVPQGFAPGSPGPAFNQGELPSELPGGIPAGEGKRGAFKKS
jgi:hypothetical protein